MGSNPDESINESNLDYNNLSNEQKELIDNLYENRYISRVSYRELIGKDNSKQNTNTSWKPNVETRK